MESQASSDDGLRASCAIPFIEAEAERFGLLPRGFLDGESLRSLTLGLPATIRGKFGVDRARGALVAGLRYGEGPRKPPAWAAEPLPLARLARFVRSDWYGELSFRLRAVGKAGREALAAAGLEPGPSRDWRYLANSELPERPLALAAGLGHLGKNGLLLASQGGPGLILGLLLLPFDPASVLSPYSAPPTEALIPGALCGSCSACVEACPTGAIRPEGGLIRERCLQQWSTVEGPRPPAIEAAWGERLYGCDACIEACPQFRPDPSRDICRGALGPGLSARRILEASEAELRERLRGTALGMGWIAPGALQRNAALVLAGARNKCPEGQDEFDASQRIL